MKTPPEFGGIVSVFPVEIVNWPVESVQKQSSLPAPAPVELRMTAYLAFVSGPPFAVNIRPGVVYVNFICLAEAPTVHLPVAGGRLRPPATYPPVAEISPTSDAHVETPALLRFKMLALAEGRSRAILNTPALRVMAPIPIFLIALAYSFHGPAAMIHLVPFLS